jgi:hypothetical protein
MQAIHSKYLGPTGVKGARVRATCAHGSIVIGWDWALNEAQNHAHAARQLQLKIAHQQHADHWLAPMVTGSLPDSSYVHVFAGAPA